MNLPFVGTIEKVDGKYVVVPDFEERFQLHLAKLKVGTRVTHPVKKFHKTNTPKQKAYLHGVVIPITTAFMGYARHEREHVYGQMKLMYLRSTDDKGNDYIRELRENSDNPADTQLVSWFTDQIRQMVSMQYGFDIPDPDKNYNKGEVEDLVTEIERG